MTFELGIAITATLCGVFGIMAAWYSRAGYRNCRELLEFTGSQIEELETSLAAMQAERETSERKQKDQARRVAWLEARVRQPKAVKRETFEEIMPAVAPQITAKSSLTERRHRILSLASRGQSAETIAQTLGMMPGEVELMMNLNRQPSNSFV